MKDAPLIESIRSWIHQNAGLFSKLVCLSFLVFGILVVIGAIRNWDWIFRPDESYHNRWTIGQVSRYLGRTPARIIGFVGGLFLITLGSYWTYLAFSRN